MSIKTGIVYLVGAGPGDPELMTIRATKLLQVADTVIHDRLIPHEVLGWCRAGVGLIDVGKFPDHHRIDQEEINKLLVEHAQRGEIVVRLKGGDPFVFGRGQEELEHCRQAGVECLVVPGISSCLAAPAAVGIPVTSRGIARSFAVVTGQTDPNLDGELDFGALVAVDTIVILMSSKNLAEIVQSLIAAGKAPETPAAAIENATLPQQRVVFSTLDQLAKAVQSAGLSNPLVSVIGEVAELANADQGLGGFCNQKN